MTPIPPGDDEMTERLLESLRLSEAKFSGIISIASEAIISVDDSQSIVLFNQGAEQIFGYLADEVMGKPLDVLLPEEYHHTHREEVREFGRSPVMARRMGDRDTHIMGRRKNGEIFPAEASISKQEIGGHWLFTAVLRDISERKRIEKENAELLERAQDAARTRDDVLRIVSHDLGNSLSGILVTTRVLLRTLPETPGNRDTRKRIESIRHLTEQMQRLRQDLLDVARIEAGHLSIVAERHEPEALVDSVFDDFEALAQESGLKLLREVDPHLPQVVVDRERILQVFSNLVTNAIKFTPVGGAVTLGAHRVDGVVRFSVSDEGSGIPPEDLPHIFDRYWQAKSANRAGAGLGLAIAKGLVEAQGGSIEVASAVNEGSAFSFSLPAAPE